MGLHWVMHSSEMNSEKSTQTPKNGADNELHYALSGLEQHERRELELLQVRLQQIEALKAELLSRILDSYLKWEELVNILKKEEDAVVTEVDRRVEALRQLSR